jgi:hypothetical protein
MAKIFRTESLSVNGDNIRLTSASTDTYKLTTAAGTTIMDKTNADIDSDVSSLKAVDVELDSDVSSLATKRTEDVSSLQAVTVELDSDVSSLKAVDVELDSDVSSLATKRTEDVSSLAAVDVELDSDVSSLAAKITTNDVQVASKTLTVSDIDETITFGTEFASTPSVVGSLKSTDASDPIIACQMSAISTTAVTFQFSDEIPNGNYTLEILASI